MLTTCSKERVSHAYVIKVNLHILPSHIWIILHELKTLTPIVDLSDREKFFGCWVEAVVELSSKKVDSHDAEDEPKDQADQENIEDGWNGPHQSVHHHLCK